MTLASLLIAVVAAIHLAILWLEMFAWRTMGPRVFRTLPAALFGPTATMAANQGLYNGFLAAGLIWSGFVKVDQAVALFFLACVFVAGLYGAWSVSRRILFVQSVPAALAILALLAWPISA